MAIYKLTGINSSSQAAKEGRFILAEDGDAIYAAEFLRAAGTADWMRPACGTASA